MKNNFAEDFYEVIEVLGLNADLLQRVKQLIQTKEIVGKSLEGGDRKQKFKDVLTGLVEGQYSLEESYLLVNREISELTSIHRGNNRVFSNGWAERLVRTNLSKFYNQAVLLYILEQDQSICFIPHSRREKEDSPCTAVAGRQHDAKIMLKRLIISYEQGEFTKELKIPNHPYCTHVVIPVFKI